MGQFLKLIIGAALVLGAVSSARGQALAPGRALAWPTEFADETFSCDSFASQRARYMQMSRPTFNCTPGVDCPQDLEPGPGAETNFLLFYDWVDKGNAEVDVTFSSFALQIVQAMTENMLKDMDGVARSKRRLITVVAHTDTTGTAAQNRRIAEKISICVKNMVEVSTHLNGYEGAYDFPIEVDARGASSPMVMTGPGVREPQNRRSEIMIRY